MAAVGNGARQIRDRALSTRSIRVLVSPTPTSFAERRSVLQVLEQFGPVEVFKMSPGYYSNFISVAKQATTAQKLVASSPLTYSIAEPSRTTADDIYAADLDEPESFSSVQPSVAGSGGLQGLQGLQGPQGPQGQQGQGQNQKQQQFKLEILPAPEHRHRFAMSGSPLHHSWPLAYQKDQSFVAATLKQSLPKTMAGKGLAHWLVGLGSAPRMERKAKRLRVKGWLPSNMRRNE